MKINGGKALMKEAIKKGISLLIASAMLIGTLPAFAQEPEVETAEDVAAVETVVDFIANKALN